ncbi:major facilitator superfamily transporter [Xylona heveae TC161]|uniref:Major facilitator superfamily transporter n=1 Tax=Xylona heveae (strain CBS 132557 / TC161) TaxID=1328760 RepID=A0A164ZWQ5_XYLHT|nr:major facilitator superfamily transporter [Xylona heveae TC161]KZF19629.1 major facilitator superfamily transporter [Xylona heveae TC161]
MQVHNDEHTQLLPNHVTAGSILPEAEEDYDADTESYRRSAGSYGTNATDIEAVGDKPALKPADTEQKPARSLAGVISVLLLGVFLSNCDGSIVLATNSLISSQFDDLESSGWLVSGSLLATCAMQPIYGRFSDIFGRRNMLLTAYSLFSIGAATCWLGNTMWLVILGRAIAGAGAAGMTSLVSILITDLVSMREVASWRSYVNVVATTGRSLGGPIGGFLADTIGWRWSFFSEIPVTLVAGFLVFCFIKERQQKDEEQKNIREKLKSVDILGALTLALTIVNFVLALDLGGHKFPWTHPLVLGSFGASLFFGIVFVLVESYWAKQPIFPLHLLVNRDIASAYLIMVLQSAAQFGMMFTIPLYFQVTENASATNAGVHLFPSVAGNAVGALCAGFFIKRTGRYKALTVTATLLASFGYLLLILRWHGHTNILESLYIFPCGFGTGVAMSSVFVGLGAGVDTKFMAIAAAGVYLSNSIGTVTGLSIVNAVLQSCLKPRLQKGLDGYADKDKIIRDVLSDISNMKHLKDGASRIVVQAYVESLEKTHFVSLCCTFFGSIIALCWREHKL